MTTTTRRGIATVLGLAAFALAFLLSGRIWFRADLSRNHAATLHEVSLNLYRELDDPARITYYVSGRLAAAHPAPGAIDDLLREYAAQSRGRITYRRVDPERAGIEREVTALGIAPQQIQVVEGNETTLATVYTGILIEHLDRRAVLPVAFSLDTLEYDVTSRLRALARGETRELGALAGGAGRVWETDYGMAARELAASGYAVRELAPGEEIPAGLRCVLALGGDGLDDAAVAALERYVQAGGRALFAVDGVTVDPASLEARAVDAAAGLPGLLARWGAAIRPALVLDTAALTVTFQVQTNGAASLRRVRYPAWVAALDVNGSATHPVTARFAGLDLYWPSPLDLWSPDGVTAEILFTTTPGAWLQTGDFVTNPDELEAAGGAAGAVGGPAAGGGAGGVAGGPAAGGGAGSAGSAGAAVTTAGAPYPLAASLTGVFPGGSRPARVIVIGDADFAGPYMQATGGVERNLDFLVRAVDWLSSDDDLLAIRGLAGGAPRLDRVADPARRSRAMNASRSLNVVMIPALAAVAAALAAWRRRRS